MDDGPVSRFFTADAAHSRGNGVGKGVHSLDDPVLIDAILTDDVGVLAHTQPIHHISKEISTQTRPIAAKISR